MSTTYRIPLANVPHLTDAKIEMQAATLRSAYEKICGSIEFPFDVQDLIWSFVGHRDKLELEENASLGYDQNGERVVGSTTGDYEGGIIRIDHSISDTSLFRFTLAHELGHWVLHRDLLAATCARYKGHGNGLVTLYRNIESESKARPEEWQANRFAVHLLMPEKNVREVFAKRISQEPLNYQEQCQYRWGFSQICPTLRHYSRRLASKESPYDMRRYFRVSREAMAIRLEELGLVIDKALDQR